MSVDNETNLAKKARTPLFILRLSVGLFLMQWALEKIFKAEQTAGIFEHFYGLNLALPLSQMLGGAEILLAAAILAGFKRRLTYGAAFGFHLISTVATWQQIIHPWTGSNHLFSAAVPLLAALWLLFQLAEHDTLLALDARQ